MPGCGYNRRMTSDTLSEHAEPSAERLRQWHRLFGIAP